MINLVALIVHPRYHRFYPNGPESITRVISTSHATRIKSMLANTQGTIVLGGQVDVERRYVAPTIVRDVKGDDALMDEYVAEIST